MIISAWRINEDILVNSIGIRPEVYSSLGNRVFPEQWSKKLPNNGFVRDCSANDILIDSIGKIFTSSNDYKITQFISKQFFGSIAHNEHYKNIEGIFYPTVKRVSSGENFALLSNTVDDKLEFVSAREFEITSLQEKPLMDMIAQALPNGKNIQWQFGIPKWKTEGIGTGFNLVHRQGPDDWGWYDNSSGYPSCWEAYTFDGIKVLPNIEL